MTHLYVQASDFRESTSIPDGVGDGDVDQALAAASRAIEKLCRRRFWLDESDVTRRYTATSYAYVSIDDAATITQVVSDGTTLAADDDYFAEPLNAAVDGEPFRWLVSGNGRFSTGRGLVAVTGRFGWPTVPEQVPQMVTILASRLVKRTREAPFGVVGLGGLDGAAVRLAKEDPEMMLLIRALTRFLPVVA